jgi:hypothetical protein
MTTRLFVIRHGERADDVEPDYSIDGVLVENYAVPLTATGLASWNVNFATYKRVLRLYLPADSSTPHRRAFEAGGHLGRLLLAL